MQPAIRAAIVACCLASTARAGSDQDAYLGRLAATVRDRLAAFDAAHGPKLSPPVKVDIKWRAVRLGSIEPGAAFVALAGADLDGDGRGELYVVTAREVVAFGIRSGRPVELGRVPFAGERTLAGPREVVGTAVVEGPELVAASSAYVKELRVGWANKKLVAQPGGPGFLVCPGERAPLASGRNYFGSAGNHFYAVRCRDDLVDAEGHPLRVRAELDLKGKLAVTVQRCTAGGKACQLAGTAEYTGAGAAFELDDIDRDGTPEVIVSDDSALPDPDYVKVIAFGRDDKRSVFKKQFNGGVAGIASIDSDGNKIAEVFAAVRLPGATRVDLWRLD